MPILHLEAEVSRVLRYYREHPVTFPSFLPASIDGEIDPPRVMFDFLHLLFSGTREFSSVIHALHIGVHWFDQKEPAAP